MSDEAKIKRVREMRDFARRNGLIHIDVLTVDLTAIVDENDRLRARVAELEAERDTAREAYAALWVFMDQVAREERPMTAGEADWFYTGQPEAIWDALPIDDDAREDARGGSDG